MKKSIIISLLAVCAATAIVSSADGKNTRRRLIKPSRRPVLTTTPTPIPTDTITDITQINTILKISDYQKTVRSRVESMLLTNLSATDTIKAVTIDLNYTDAEGRQLNRRELTLTVTVPPGETRHASSTSWDRQQLFYYHLTPPARPTDRTRSFHVAITPIALILSTNK